MSKIIALLLIAIWPIANAAEPPHMGDGMPTYDQFEKTISSYPYKAAEVRAFRIRTGIVKVAKCMTKAQIVARLGSPDFSQMSFGPKGPGEKWLGSSWTYYLSKHEDVVSGSDQLIEIFFDTNDHAQWIVPSNVSGAREIGAFDEVCPSTTK